MARVCNETKSAFIEPKNKDPAYELSILKFFDIIRTVFLRACRLLQNQIRITSRS